MFKIFRSSGPVSYGFASLENSAMLDTETICSVGSNSEDESGPPSLQNELDLASMEPTAQLQHAENSPPTPLSPVVQNGKYIEIITLSLSYKMC